jgi:hypothetical protein
VHSPSAGSGRRGEAGSVTAEFATVLPAVVVVLACCLTGIQLAAQQVRLQDAAAAAARSVARGDSLDAAAGLVPHSRLRVEQHGDIVCVTASAPGSALVGVLRGITVRASSCALGGGR